MKGHAAKGGGRFKVEEVSILSLLFFSIRLYKCSFPSSLHVFEILACWFLPLADSRAILLNWRHRRQFEPKLPRRGTEHREMLLGRNLR